MRAAGSMGCDPARLPAVERQHAGHLLKGAHGHRAYCDLLDVPAARVRDRNVRLRRPHVAARDPGREERRRDRHRRRGVEPAAPRCPRDRVAGSAGRLRPSSTAAGSTRHRRRPVAARVRDLRRRRRRVRAVVRAGARTTARPDASHRPFGADGSPARSADRLVRGGGACDRDDGDSARAASADERLRRGQDPRRPAWGAGRPRSPKHATARRRHVASTVSDRVLCSRRSG